MKDFRVFVEAEMDLWSGSCLEDEFCIYGADTLIQCG